MDLRTLGAANPADEAARRWQRGEHLGANSRELLHILAAVELEGTIGVLLAVAGDEVGLFGRLVLRAIPVVNAPVNAHAAEHARLIDVLDFLADDFLGVERTLLAFTVEEDLEVVVKKVVVGISAGGWIRKFDGQLDDLPAHSVVGNLDGLALSLNRL